MKILKRNQIIISVLALMLITVGYMSYTSNITDTLETGALMNSETMASIGDAKLVNSNNIVENENENGELQNDEPSSIEVAESAINSNEESGENITSASSTSTTNSAKDSTASDSSSSAVKTTSATTYETDYFIASKLERDKMYSQMLETYQGLAENSSVSAEQKNMSTQEISNINSKKNSIMIAENLIKNLGFEDVVIFVNDNSTSVIIKAESLSEADIAQIQNIVCREIGVEVDEIHISLK